MKEMALSRENGERQKGSTRGGIKRVSHVLRVGMHFWLTGLLRRAPVVLSPAPFAEQADQHPTGMIQAIHLRIFFLRRRFYSPQNFGRHPRVT